jgi:hypothetical protein
MSIRTIASTFAAKIAHLARAAQSPAPPDVVPGTLTRARELVSAVHRVATTSVQDARALLDGTIRFAAYALGYQRTATTNSPPRRAQPEATEVKPEAEATDVKPEATDVKPETTDVKPEATDVKPQPQAIEVKPQATELKPEAIALKPQAELKVTELKLQATDVKPQATELKPQATCDRAPPGHAPTATAPSRVADDGARPPTTTDPSAAPLAPPPTTPTRGASNMSELIEAIRAAVAPGATAEQKAIGAQACRTILTAIGAEPGKPIVLPGAPKAHPLSGITVDQALDLVIARLTMIANSQDTATAPKTTAQPERRGPQATPQPQRRGPQIPLVDAPRPARAVQEKRTK